MIYTKNQIPKEINNILPDIECSMDNQTLSFWFDEQLFNSVMEYLVEKKVRIRDIELQKMTLDVLFKGERA